MGKKEPNKNEGRSAHRSPSANYWNFNGGRCYVYSNIRDFLCKMGFEAQSAVDISEKVVKLADDLGSFNNASDPSLWPTIESPSQGDASDGPPIPGDSVHIRFVSDETFHKSVIPCDGRTATCNPDDQDGMPKGFVRLPGPEQSKLSVYRMTYYCHECGFFTPPHTIFLPECCPGCGEVEGWTKTAGRFRYIIETIGRWPFRTSRIKYLEFIPK